MQTKPDGFRRAEVVERATGRTIFAVRSNDQWILGNTTRDGDRVVVGFASILTNATPDDYRRPQVLGIEDGGRAYAALFPAAYDRGVIG